MFTRLSLTVLCAILAVPSGPAAANKPEDSLEAARRLVARARAAAKAGRLAESLKLSKQAQRLHDSAGTLCNIGIGYYNLRNWPRAELFLARCLARSRAELFVARCFARSKERNAALVATLATTYAAVENRLRTGAYGRVSLRTSPANARVIVATFGVDEPVTGRPHVWLSPGMHAIRAEAPGLQPVTKKIAVEAKSTAHLIISLRRKAVPPVVEPRANTGAKPGQGAGSSAAGTTGGAGATDRAVAHTDLTSVRPRSYSPTRGLVVSGASVGAGLALHLLALRAAGRANDIPRDTEAYDDERRKWWYFAIPAYGLYGVGAVALATTGYRWFTRGKAPAPRRSGVDVALGPRSAWLRVRW